MKKLSILTIIVAGLVVAVGTHMVLNQKEQNTKSNDPAFKIPANNQTFNISLSMSVKSNYTADEPLIVSVIMKNNLNKSVNISAPSLQASSLNFRIKTPDGQKIYYIGPHVDCYPESMQLASGEEISFELNLKEKHCYFGDSSYPHGEKYNFATLGFYEITGSYYSFSHSRENHNNSWTGSLTSNTYNFRVTNL